MNFVTAKETPDMIIFLGDGIEDAEQLGKKYPDIQMIKVLGNMDLINGSAASEELIKYAEICGRRFIITHGHMFINEFIDKKQTDGNRITSRNDMLKAIDENNADILLHGHTHEPYINRALTASGKACWIMNPGSIRRISGWVFKPAYGVLELTDAGNIEWRFVEVE
jgi:putative phosphoesterase